MGNSMKNEVRRVEQRVSALEAEKKSADENFKAAVSRMNEASAAYAKEVSIPRAEKQIGRCFRYSNSFGGPERWWMYMRITGLKGDSYFETVAIERMSDGRIDCVTGDLRFGDDGTPVFGYEPISQAEYRKHVRPLLKELQRKAGV